MNGRARKSGSGKSIGYKYPEAIVKVDGSVGRATIFFGDVDGYALKWFLSQ